MPPSFSYVLTKAPSRCFKRDLEYSNVIYCCGQIESSSYAVVSESDLQLRSIGVAVRGPVTGLQRLALSTSTERTNYEATLEDDVPKASISASTASSLCFEVRFQIVVPCSSKSRLLFATAEAGMRSILSMFLCRESVREGSVSTACRNVLSSFAANATRHVNLHGEQCAATSGRGEIPYLGCCPISNYPSGPFWG